MFSEKDQGLFEHMEDIQKRLSKEKKFKKLNFAALFTICAGLGYIGTESIALTILLGYLPVMIKANADNIIREQMLTNYHIALCDFDGDLAELQLKLKISATLP
jgi:hypothetical protein